MNDFEMRRRLARPAPNQTPRPRRNPVPLLLIGRSARERELLGRLQAHGLELGELRELIDIREAGRS